MTGAGLPRFMPGLDDALGWRTWECVEIHATGREFRLQLRRDGGEPHVADFAFANVRLKTGTPAPIISCASGPGATGRRKVHPLRLQSQRTVGGYADSQYVGQRFLSFWKLFPMPERPLDSITDLGKTDCLEQWGHVLRAFALFSTLPAGPTKVHWTICGAIAGLLCWPAMLSAQLTAEQALANSHQLFSVTGCGKTRPTEQIVVCGTNNSENRLPLPVERSVSEHMAGDIPRASADAALPRQCGVFQGQRRCNLKELRRFGYGGGSVPIRALVMLAKKAVDPDAEIGPLKGYPVDPSEIK